MQFLSTSSSKASSLFVAQESNISEYRWAPQASFLLAVYYTKSKQKQGVNSLDSIKQYLRHRVQGAKIWDRINCCQHYALPIQEHGTSCTVHADSTLRPLQSPLYQFQNDATSL